MNLTHLSGVLQNIVGVELRVSMISAPLENQLMFELVLVLEEASSNTTLDSIDL